MSDRTGFAVAKPLRPQYLSSERMNDPLVSQAHSKSWSFAAYLSENFRTDPEVSRVCWCSRSRGDYDSVRGKPLNLRNVHFVVPFHNYFVSNLSHVLGQVVDEAVVIVQDEDFQSWCPCALSMAVKRAAVFLSDSIHSRSGTESATIPAPDCR